MPASLLLILRKTLGEVVDSFQITEIILGIMREGYDVICHKVHVRPNKKLVGTLNMPTKQMSGICEKKSVTQINICKTSKSITE